jgi:protein phosphatase 1G
MAGCTANVCIITKTEMIIANAGDSRSVLRQNNATIQLSEDHKPELFEENKRIVAAGGYVMEGRINGNLNLSRALGDLEYKQDKSLKPE